MRFPRSMVRATAVVAMLALSASVVPAMAAPPSAAAENAPAVQRERSVPGHPVAVSPLPPNPMAAASAPRPVVWPVAGKSEVDLAAGVSSAGSLPVRVATVGTQAKPASSPKVTVETFDQDASKRAGLAGTLLRVADAGGAAGQRVSVELDYSGFGQAYGGDYGSRLYVAEYPACVLTTPEKAECRTGTPVRSANNARGRKLTAEISVPATTTATTTAAVRDSGTVLAAQAGNSGSGGTYGATDLAPSGSWSAGGSSGDFAYSVPLTMPAAPGGPGPQLSLSYSSGGVDGRTSATNSQASWVGDGWDLSAGGFIERAYVACMEDEGGNQGGLQTGDLCWKDEHYTVSLGGTSGKLIRDRNTGVLRPETDDGSRIEHFHGAGNGDDDGEHWKVTAPDGTQYFLGARPQARSVFTVPVYGNHTNEPCNRAAFADSSCAQAYRWNVDLVVDPRGNAMTFSYDQETNHYKRGGLRGVNTSYVAAGRLASIDYGLRSDNLVAKPPARVVFQTAERCAVGDATCDVPWDRVCNAGEDCTARYSPAFFSRVRLTRVVTQSLDGSDHRDVDSWSLRQEYPPTGDGLPRSLWLSGITRTGHVGGTASLPELQFVGIPMDNRVDAIDNLLPITRHRITRVIGTAGAVTEVRYAEHDCVRGSRMPDNDHPESNTMRCYPTYWAPQGAPEPSLDWFHKYVVTDVTEDSRTGGPSLSKTHYDYLGDGGAWHYDDNDEEDADKRTWSEWRGYGTVRTVLGDPSAPQSVTETLFLRGMDGDTLPGGGVRDVWVGDSDGGRVEDKEALKGYSLESLLYSGGRVVSAEVSDPHLIETANDGTDTANMVRTKAVAARNAQEDGSWRRTRSSTTFTTLGLPEKVDDEGDIAVTGDESCSQSTYLRNDPAWMLIYTSQVRSIAKRCGAWPGTADDVLTDVKSAYDGQAAGEAPTNGVVTETKRWTGGTTYQKVSSEKTDLYGRVTETTDVEGKKTTTVYTPATGNPTTITTTNRKGWVTTSTVDTVRGLPLTEIGVNGERADMVYDPLGRLVKVWIPGRSAANQSPTTEYAYAYHTDAPTVVTTKTLKENEQYAVSYDFYDGLMRHRQSQTPALGGGRIVTDSYYDGRGQAFKVNGGYYNTSPPAAALHGVFDWDVPNQTVTEYDDLGRPLETILKRRNEELWRTKTRYGGDNTYTTPPQGDTPTAVLKDARGRIVERRQYHAPSGTGVYGAGATFDPMTYRYNTKGQLAKVGDALGNQWLYDYDQLGRKKADVDPDRGRSTYAYNPLDQLASTTDAEGRTLAYTYDDLGRTTAMFQGSTSGPQLAEWTFDTLRKGLPTSATRFVGGNAYTQRVDSYDTLNRPTSASIVIPGNEGALAGTYTYGAGYSAVTGQLLSETIPAAGGLPAENVIHTYNDLGQPESTYGLATYASEHLYSPYGETLRVTLGVSPNKVWVKSDYQETTRRLDNFEVRRDKATQPQVSNRTFSYDPGGNITKIADLPTDGPADTQCFGYDNLRRMTSAWTPRTGDCAQAKTVGNLGGAAPYWYDFTFDKIGNRRTQVQHTAAGDVTETYTAPASGSASVRPHTISAVTKAGPGGTSRNDYTYDNTGNTRTRKIGGNTQTLDWSAEGRVTKVTEASGQTSDYGYDANGNRLLKKESAGTTLYLPGQELTLAVGATTPSAKRYYAHAGGIVAMRSSINGLSYLLGDHHGTDEVAITADKLFVTRRYSDPFGATRGAPPSFWPDDKGFVGGTKDTTGLTSVGAREYDPATGRFASVDPIVDFANPQQTHGYAYANNAPATFSDPSGLAWCVDENCLWVSHTDDGSDFTPAKEQKMRDFYNDQDKRKGVVHDSHDKACSEMGMSKSSCKQMQDDAASNKGFWQVMGEELPDIIGDLTGLTDLRDCFTKFDLWACVQIIPWGRVFKLVRSAGKIFDAVRKALKWEDRVNAARATMTKWKSRADQLIRDGFKKLDDLREQEKKAKLPDKCHSFPPGTRILLADGSSKPIEKVRLDEVVLTHDPETGRSDAHKVVGTWVHDNEPQRTEVTLDTDGPNGTATASLTATDWHPVWVPELKAWVPIGNLQAGSMLQTSSGTWVQATAVRHYAGTGKVHDLTIDAVHTYHVVTGNTATLVHNCPSADAGPSPSAGGGHATVEYDPDDGPVGHARITVTNSKGESLMTQQGVGGGWNGVGDPTGYPSRAVPAHGTMGPNTVSHRFALPNADAAMQAQLDGLHPAATLGPYSFRSNNCVTYCVDILRAGGVGIPPGARGMLELRKLLG